MKIQQLIVGDRIKITILPGITGYTIEIDGTQYESDDELSPYETRSEMLEQLDENIAVHAANHFTDEEHEEFLSLLHQVDWDVYL